MADTECVDDKEHEEPSFETVLEKLGALGKFQLIQILFCHFTHFLTCAAVLSFVFEGYEPPHVCNAVNETRLLSKYGLHNDSTAHVVYDPCEIRILSNQTGKEKEIDSMDCPNGRNFFDAKHTTFLSEWDLVCESKGVAEVSLTFFNVGQMIGALICPMLTDRFGRKPVFIYTSILMTFVEWSIVAAPDIFVVYGLKFTSGVFFQSLTSCYFVYAMEFVPPRYREVSGCFTTANWLVALLAEGAVGYLFRNHSWRYVQGATGIAGLVSLAYPFVMYESPRWLAANGRVEEALCILEKASKMNGKDFEEVKETFLAYVNHTFPSSNNHSLREKECRDFDDGDAGEDSDVIIRGSKMSLEKKVNIFDLLRNKTLRKRALITWYLFVTLLMTYYGLYMTSSGVAGDRFVNYTLLTLVELPSLVCAYYLMRKWSRRIVIMAFMGLASASLMASALLLTFAQNLEGAGVVNTALFILGKFAITAAFTVVWLLVPEIFPTNLRSTSHGFCSGMARVGGMVAPFMRPLYSVVKWAPGLIFATMCMVAVVLTYLLPESKDVNLPDTIDDAEKEDKTERVVKYRAVRLR